MTAKEWRDKGYKTIFRGGIVFLVPTKGSWYFSGNMNGRWMDYDNLSAEPWDAVVTVGRSTSADIRATVAACYCDNGVDTCDFCSGTRTATK